MENNEARLLQALLECLEREHRARIESRQRREEFIAKCMFVFTEAWIIIAFSTLPVIIGVLIMRLFHLQ